MRTLFADLANPTGRGVSAQTLRIGGREIPVPAAGRSTAVARFSFVELCGRPLGAAQRQPEPKPSSKPKPKPYPYPYP
jgi:predicted ATPase